MINTTTTTLSVKISTNDGFAYAVATDHDAEGVSLSYLEGTFKNEREVAHVIFPSNTVAPVIAALVRVTALSHPDEKETLQQILRQLYRELES
jgi:hypothetical protein